MSILIKGMEMPKEDMKNIMILADGRVFQFSGYGNPRPRPLGIAVPVPKLEQDEVLSVYDTLIALLAGTEKEERFTQIVCKCGEKRFIARNGIVVCDKCGARMEETE